MSLPFAFLVCEGVYADQLIYQSRSLPEPKAHFRRQLSQDHLSNNTYGLVKGRAVYDLGA